MSEALYMVSDFDGQTSRAGSELDMPAMLIEVTKDEGDEFVTNVIASTPTVDRAGDIVEQDWNLKNFRRNPVILWMHDRMTPPVGRAIKISAGGRGKDGALEMAIEWDVGPHNPLGTTIGKQYARGMLHAVSVGFRPGGCIRRADLPADDPRHQKLKDGEPAWMSGLVLSGNELLENSAVTVPANPEALAVRSWARQAEDPREQFRRVLTETVAKADIDWLLRAFDDPRLRAKLQAVSLALPEPEPEPDGLDHLFTRGESLAHLFPES